MTDTGWMPGSRPWASDSTIKAFGLQAQRVAAVHPAISFGALDFKASPRPERLGLVMK